MGKGGVCGCGRRGIFTRAQFWNLWMMIDLSFSFHPRSIMDAYGMALSIRGDGRHRAGCDRHRILSCDTESHQVSISRTGQGYTRESYGGLPLSPSRTHGGWRLGTGPGPDSHVPPVARRACDRKFLHVVRTLVVYAQGILAVSWEKKKVGVAG